MPPSATSPKYTIYMNLCISFLKINCTKTCISAHYVCSHRSRDDERISKPASTPAKLPEEVPLPKAKESAVAREDKQLPPLPGHYVCIYSSELNT